MDPKTILVVGMLLLVLFLHARGGLFIPRTN